MAAIAPPINPSSFTPKTIPQRLGFEGGNMGYAQMANAVTGSISRFVAAPMQSNENTLAQAVRKTQNACDIAALVVGNYDRSRALNAYNKMDFGSGSANAQYLNQLTGVAPKEFKVDVTRAGTKGPLNLGTQTVNMNTFSVDNLTTLRQTGSVRIGQDTYTVKNHNEFKQMLGNYDSHFDYGNKLQNANFNGARASSMQHMYSTAVSRMEKNADLSDVVKATNSGRGTEHIRRTAQRTERELDNKINAIANKGSTRLKTEISRVTGHGHSGRPTAMSEAQKQMIFRHIDSDAHLSENDKVLLKNALESRNEVKLFQESGIIEGAGLRTSRTGLHAGRRIVMRNLMGPDFYQFYAMARSGVMIAKHGSRLIGGIVYNKRIKHLDRMQRRVAPIADRIVQPVVNRSMGFAPGTKNETITNSIRQRKERLIDEKQFTDSLRGKTFSEKRQLKRGRRETITDKKIDYKAKKLAERRDRLNRRGNSRAAVRVDRRRVRTEERLERRYRRRKVRQDRMQRRTAFKTRINNALTKLATPFKKIIQPIQYIVNLPRKIINKIVAAILMPIAQFILTYFVAIPIGILLTVYFIWSFCSNIIPDIGDMTKKWASDRVRQLNDQNYLQYILDQAGSDIATDFYEIACTDATKHFAVLKNMQLSKKLPEGKSDADFHNGGITKDWYARVNYGEIGNVWVWEESDDTTKYDTTSPSHNAGTFVYNDPKFVDSPDFKGYVKIETRKSLDNVNANMVPIMCMMHSRYMNDINFETWTTALGYFYYMYAMSHDISRHDSKTYDGSKTINDVHYTNKPGYAYRMEPACDRNCLYSQPLDWDPVNHEVIGRENEVCTNIYIHGDPKSLSTSVVKTALAVKLFANNQDVFSNTIYQKFSATGAHSSKKGFWILDSSGENSPQHCSAQECPDGNCTNYITRDYDHDYTKCGKIEHTEHTSECCPDAYENCTGVLNFDSDSDDVMDTHVHDETCSGGLDTSQCKYIETNGGDGLHTHTSPDCYVQVAICCGHCGGHITPTVDVVQMMTYQGLARQDDFKTPHYLTREEIVGEDFTSILNLADAIRKKFTAENSPFASIKGWRAYWYTEACKWYIPYPRSIWGAASTTGKSILSVLAGSGEENPTYNDPTGKGLTRDIDFFEGWFRDEDVNKMNQLWLSTLYHQYGSFYCPNEMIATDGTKYGDEKYVQAEKAWQEPMIAKEWSLKFPKLSLTGAAMLSAQDIANIMNGLTFGDGVQCTDEEHRRIAEAALAEVGKWKYAHGGVGRTATAIDCSNFVRMIVNEKCGLNWNIGRASDIADAGTPINWDTIQPGTIIAYREPSGWWSGHTAIFMGFDANGKVQIVDSSGSMEGVYLHSITDSYKNKFTSAFNP